MIREGLAQDNGNIFIVQWETPTWTPQRSMVVRLLSKTAIHVMGLSRTSGGIDVGTWRREEATAAGLPARASRRTSSCSTLARVGGANPVPFALLAGDGWLYNLRAWTTNRSRASCGRRPSSLR